MCEPITFDHVCLWGLIHRDETMMRVRVSRPEWETVEMAPGRVVRVWCERYGPGEYQITDVVGVGTRREWVWVRLTRVRQAGRVRRQTSAA